MGFAKEQNHIETQESFKENDQSSFDHTSTGYESKRSQISYFITTRLKYWSTIVKYYSDTCLRANAYIVHKYYTIIAILL